MKVITKDFQILSGEHTFEFPKGVTILQGESATGKSSLIYAIKYCLTNPSGVGYCINHDSKYAEVTIENNGNSVTWVKTPTSCEYRNNNTGQSFVKASKLTSKDIADLGFYFDPKGNCINLHDEWSVLFPYALNDSELFKLFEDIFSISCSYQIVDDMKKDEQQVKTEINGLNQNIDKQTQQLNNVENMLFILDEDVIQQHLNELQTKQQYLHNVKADYVKVQQYTPFLNINVPEELNIQQLLDCHTQLSNLTKDLTQLNKCVKLLQLDIPQHKDIDLQPNKYLNDYNTYMQHMNNINLWTQQLNQLQQQYEAKESELKTIKVCPTCGRPLQDVE